MDAEKQKNLRLAGGEYDKSKTVGGRPGAVGAGSSAGLDERCCWLDLMIDGGASAMLSRLSHSFEDFRDAWLRFATVELQIGAGEMQGCDAPLRAERLRAMGTSCSGVTPCARRRK